jgi:hypothetical protein
MWRVFVVAAAVLLAGCDSSEPVAVPDLVGMALPEARDAVEDSDFELDEVDGSGRDRSIFSPGNWTVDGQTPSAGSMAGPRSTVTVQLINVRDVEDEPEADEPEAEDPEQEEPEPEERDEVDEPEPTEPVPTETRSTSLEADIREGPQGLRIVTEEDVHDCKVDLNAGLIRSGYTTNLAMLTAGEPYTVPWGDLTNRDGERFDYQTHRPEMLTLSCTGPDGGHLYDTWSW